MYKPKNLSLHLINDSLNDFDDELNIPFILTVIRDNTDCDDTFYLLNKLIKRM